MIYEIIKSLVGFIISSTLQRLKKKLKKEEISLTRNKPNKKLNYLDNDINFNDLLLFPKKKKKK